MLKILEILRFFQYFFLLKKKIPQISNFSKKRNICTRRDSKECMYQVSSNSLHKRGFYSTLNVKKWLLFRAFGRNTMHFHISILFRFLCNKRCSKVIFRVLDEKNQPINMYYDAKWPKSASWPRDFRWPWPQKRSPLATDDAQICHRPESCRFIGCLCVYSRHLRRKGIKWKCQTFCVWPDLWRHRWPRGQIFKLYLKDLVQAFPLPFEFSPRLLVSEIDGGPLRPPPPPPPAEGRGRTRPSRARVKAL